MPYGSPVFAGLSVMEDLLTKRRDQQRQDMMDEIYRRNIDSQIQAREDNAKTQAVYRQGMANDYNMQALKNFDLLHEPGSNLNNPATREWLKSINAGDMIEEPFEAPPTEPATPQTPSEPSEVTVGEDGKVRGMNETVGVSAGERPQSHGYRYKGSPARITEQRQRQLLQSIMANQNDFGKLDRMTQLLTLQQAGVEDGDKITGPMMTGANIYDEATNKFSPAMSGGQQIQVPVTSGNSILQRSRPPQGRAPHVGFGYGDDPKNPGQKVGGVINYETNTWTPITGGTGIQTTLPRTGAGGAEAATILGIPNTIYSNLVRVRNSQNMTPDGEMAAVISALQTAKNVDPELLQQVLETAKDPKVDFANRDVDSLMGEFYAEDENGQEVQLPPQDAMKVRLMLQLLKNDL